MSEGVGMSLGFKNFLNSTADQIHSRYEVEKVLNDLVQTVELHHSQSDLYTLKKNYGVAKSLGVKLLCTIDGLDTENRAIRNELSFIKKKSSIVREKFALQISTILKESKQLSTHKSTIVTLERRLADIEREYTILKEKVSMQETVSSIVDISSHMTEQSASGKAISSPSKTKSVTVEEVTSDSSGIEIAVAPTTNGSSMEPEKEISTSTVNQVLSTPELAVMPVADTAVTVTSRPKVYVIKTLLALDNEVFLNTFSFLTTVEVLNFAQTCRMLFRRVNQLFGMESQVVMDSWTKDFEKFTNSQNGSLPGENCDVPDTTSGSNNDATATVPTSKSSSDLTLTQSITSSILSSPLVKLATGGKLGVFQGTQSVQASPTPAPASTSAPAITATNASPALATAAPPTASAPIASGAASVAVGSESATAAAASNGAAPPPGGLTREMAEQLAKKLNAAELTAIKALSDLLRKQTGQMAAIKEEKELVETKLQSTESMRDFLVEKLRSAEQALKSTFGDLAAARNQYSVDQEVINYLDLRGQELEAHNGQLRKELERLQAMYELQRGKHSHSENRLLSELAECRTRLEEREAGFKAQKRLLVKEVKALRQQVDRATSEKNQYRSQLQALRDALLAAGGAGNANPLLRN